MAKTADKLVNLDYDELLTLAIIEGDEDLKQIFKDEVSIPFTMLYTLSKEDKLNNETKNLIKSLFEHIILTKKTLIDRYVNLARKDGKDIGVIEEEEEIAESSVVEEELIISHVEPIQEKIAPPIAESKPAKKEKNLPRRYGKNNITKDIEAQGGKATPLQNAMLKVNSLKNIYVNLSARGIKDMLGGTNLLSDADCRDIVAVVTIAERKLEKILTRKK